MGPLETEKSSSALSLKHTERKEQVKALMIKEEIMLGTEDYLFLWCMGDK